MPTLLATAQGAALPLGGGGGPSWWQLSGALVAVFMLLFIVLKLLGRLPRPGAHGAAGLLAVWSLGARREVQVVRLHDEVHYLYKQDGALVLLRSVPLAQYEAAQPAPSTTPGGLWPRLVGALRGR